MHNLLISLFVRSIEEAIPGRRVGSCRYLKPILSICLDREAQRASLVTVLSDPGPFFFVSREDPLEHCTSKNVFEEVLGRKVLSISQFRGDRIVLIRFGAPRSADLALFLHLYGATGKAVLERNGAFVEGINSKRTIPPCEEVMERANLATISRDELLSLQEINQPLSRYVHGLDDLFTTLFAKEGGGLDGEQLLEFRDRLLSQKTSFYLVATGRPSQAVPSPVPLAGRGRETFGPFGDAAAAAAALGDVVMRYACRAVIDRLMKPVRYNLGKKRKLLGKLRSDLDRAKNHESLRREAEILSTYRTRVKPGAKEVVLPDPYREDAEVRIGLDPSLPIQRQIERRFKRASKMRKSIDALGLRIRTVEKEISHLEQRCSAIEDEEELAQAIRSLQTAAEEIGITAQGKVGVPGTRQAVRYRRFDLDAVWFVLVGRNNEENEELTFHVSSPSDYWLHAQQVPGSHVILKSRRSTGNPPERILRKAAGVAAYYSRARHASLVPVVYTLRKYVRKPRRTKPGRVVCEKEKTIFAEPWIPARNEN